MGLSCSCGEWDGDGWTYLVTTDFEPLDTKRRRRCRSCGELIDTGADSLRFDRVRGPRDDIEASIYGEDGEIYLAPWYMCEDCGGLYMALDELGFCLFFYRDRMDMKALVKEYNEMRKHGYI